MKLVLFIFLLGVTMSASASNMILKFTARWCPPCKLLAPILEAASEKTGVPYTEIDVDVDKSAQDKYKIRAIPTMVFEKDGREIYRFTGLKTEKELVDIINHTFQLTTTE